MYFVVILIKSKKVLTLPASHILNLDIVRKINAGLKTWKKQLVFFSPVDHDPNFNHAIREDFDENCDGVYWANILRAFHTKEQAESYAVAHREVLPVNYFDQPAEQDSLDATIGGAFDADPERNIKRERQDSIAETEAPTDESDDESFVGDRDGGDVDDEDAEVDIDNNSRDEENEPVNDRNDELMDVDGGVDGDNGSSSDDEVQIVSWDPSLGTGVMPAPTRIKSEDVLTGTEKFTESENGDRYYNKSGMTLRASVVDTLSLWNSTDPSNNKDNDFLFVQFLLIEIFGGKSLALKQLDDEKLQFVNEVFAYRVKNDECRLADFQNLVDKVTDQLCNKMLSDNQDQVPQNGNGAHSTIHLSF